MLTFAFAMEPTALQQGTTLQNGKYTILRQLGQGGFGITYEGVQAGLNRRVAIKEFFMSRNCGRQGTAMIIMGTSEQSEEVDLFRIKFSKEAQLISSLDRAPHVVRIYDIFDENNTTYYVMEFVEGGSLAEFVRSNGLLEEARVISLITQTAEALGALHERQTMHLDVKPSNILLRKDSQGRDDVVLIDFGVSKHYDVTGRQTTSTPIGLSKGFAPIEQYRDGGVREFSPATDVYSLGATLYYLLTKQSPPEAADLLSEPLTRPANVSQPLWQVITRAMSVRKADRYQSMQQLTEALRRVPVTKQEPEEEKPVALKIKDEVKTLSVSKDTVKAASVSKETVCATPKSKATVVSKSSETTVAKKKRKWLWPVIGVATIFIIAIITCYHFLRDESILTLRGHLGFVHSVAYSPDGQRIASASGDKTVRVWDANTGECLMTLKGHTEGVYSVVFSPGGMYIASASEDRTIRLWNANTGKGVRLLVGHANSVNSVAFDPYGRLLASASNDYTILIWNTETGELLRAFKGHEHPVNSVAFSPDGHCVASASDDRTICIWDINTGECLRTLEGHKDCVKSVTYSPDGQRIASASADNTIRIWDASTGECMRTLYGHNGCVFSSIAFSPDGHRIASASVYGEICLWDANTGLCMNTLERNKWAISSVAFSPDGQRLVSASWDKTVKIWDVSE